MHLHLLIPTQATLRNWEQVEQMTRFAAGGGIFSRESLDSYAVEWGMRASPLIQVSEFEDGQLYLHDGHHRLYSIWNAGRQELQATEFEVTKWTYAAYIEVNRKNGWVTPFDPRTEVRLMDFKEWKQELDWLFSGKDIAEAEFEQFVRSNRNRYAADRNVSHIRDLSIHDPGRHQQVLRRV